MPGEELGRADGAQRADAQRMDGGGFIRYEAVSVPLEVVAEERIAVCVQRGAVLAIATRTGVVRVWTGSGEPSVYHHGGPVHALALDPLGKYCVSCGATQTLFHWLHKQKEPWVIEIRADVVAISPSGEKTLCVGGADGVLNIVTKTIFGPSQTVLHGGEGPISSIEWRGANVAWANSFGVKVFNLKDQKPITFVPKPQRNGRAVTDGCFVAWPKDSLILLGWEEGVVQVLRLEALAQGGSRAEVTNVFRFPYAPITGLDAFAWEEIRIVTSGVGPTMHHICKLDGKVVATDMVPGCVEGKLAAATESRQAVIWTTSTVTQAIVRPLPDHAGWLLEENRFEEALEVARRAGTAFQWQVSPRKRVPPDSANFGLSSPSP
jgi:hypothetical protein